MDWRQPEVWAPIAVVTAVTGLLGWAIYEGVQEDRDQIRVLSTQTAPVQVAPVAATPGAAVTTVPGVQQAPTVIVQQPHHAENSFLENMMIWRGVSSIFDSSPSTVHTREVHHVVHQPAPAAPAPVTNHYNYGSPAPQHHGFVAAPSSTPKPVAAPAKPMFTPVKASPSAIKTTSSPARSMSSSSFRSSSSSSSSGGRR